MNEALRIAPIFLDWVKNKSPRLDRKKLLQYFDSIEVVEEKVLQTLFYLSGAIYLENDKKSSKAGIRRHKKVRTLKNAIFPEFSFGTVFRVIEVIIDLSEYYGISSEVHIDNSGRFDRRVKYTCNLSEKIISEITYKSIMAFYPTPIEEKPVDWEYCQEANEIKGGFHSYQYPMVRAKMSEANYKLYKKPIFEALNYIQSQPWKINEPILRVMQKEVKEPIKEDFMKTPFPDIDCCKWGIKLDKEHNLSDSEVEKLLLNREHFIKQSAIYNSEKSDFESAVGKYRSVKLAMTVAEDYVGKTFYFPHNYDFRGRVYPISVGLTPQGSSAVKALLLYANTKPATDEGMEWNWAYLATLYGDDKLNFKERVKRGIELINTDYKEADEPYEFLSHQLELQKWIRDDKYEPNTRIHVDASCSGSQICSSMIGDLSGAQATNVIPIFDENGIQIRQDAYMRVAEKAIENTKIAIMHEQDSEIKEAYCIFLGQLELNGRKIAKNPTMVSIYGGSINGMKDNVFENLRSFGVDRKYLTPSLCYKYAKIIYNSIGGTLIGGKMFETYIQKMTSLIAKGNKPVYWTTVDGFHVLSKNKKQLAPNFIKCLLPNSRRVSHISKKNYSEDISVPKTKSGSSPNFVHTIDSTFLRIVALKMRDSGIVMQDFIHDSFGCHANEVNKMLQLTKEAFVELMSTDIMKTLHIELMEQMPEDEKIQEKMLEIVPPKLNDFDPTKGGLNKVFESEWFFA
jgi:DNA-directed RNA polymerase